MNPKRSSRLDASTLTLLILPPLFWAGNAIVGRLAVGTIAPMALNALRWFLASLILLPFAWRGVVAHRALLMREWRVIAALGALGVGSYNALQYLALTTSTPNNVTLIAASTPVFTLLFGALCFDEQVGARRSFGALVSIVGVLLVLVRGDATRLITLSFVPGDLFMLAAAVVWSIYTWVLKTRRPDVPLTTLLFAQMAAGLLLALPCAAIEAAFFDAPSHFDTPRAWLVLAYVSVLPSLVAYFCWDRGVSRAGATLPVFFANLTPVFAAVLSALLLGEWPQWYHAAGLLLILAGIRLAGR
ncbi:MAG: DMT family transporter [Burkholderiaceae bacterium]